MKLKLRFDHRDLHYHKFYGQTTVFPEEFNTDKPTVDDQQPIGDVKCTAYSVCGIAEDISGKKYDVQDLFDRIASNSQGADPRDTISESIKGGIAPIGQTLRESPFKSYFVAHKGSFDAFDNCRSAIMLAGYPIMAWGKWFNIWGISTTLPIDTAFSGYHAVIIEGWTMRLGQPMLIIESWCGRKQYISRTVFNYWASTWGFSTAVLATEEVDKANYKKSVLGAMLDTIKNALTLMQQVLLRKPIIGRIPTLYDVGYSLIGKHLTLDNSVDKSVGCGQAVSYVLRKYGAPIPRYGISGTASLAEWLSDNANEIPEPRPGCIIVSITDTGNGSRRGHIGIVGYRTIMSNSSKTGLWSCDFTLESWKRYYVDGGGLVTKYFAI